MRTVLISIVMNAKSNSRLWLTFLLLALSWPVFSQTVTTIVHGRVIDAGTQEPMPYVSLKFDGTNLGVVSDINGNFFIETKEKVSTLTVSLVGYQTTTLKVALGKDNELSVLMREGGNELKEVTVRVEKYRNKGNPAVELIKKVIENKDKNRKEGLDFYEYEKYEKVEFALNNITNKTRNGLVFRPVKYIFDYADTSKLTGKVNLLMYLRESLSDVYYRKSPNAQKEYVRGERNVVIKNVFDLQGISFAVNNMYQEVNFYDNAIDLLTMQFISPLSPISPAIYRFYIEDTVSIKGTPCAHMYFAPRNKTDVAFMGHLYVALDSTYALRKIEVGIPKDINLNWVNEMQISQEFDWVGNSSDTRGLMLSNDRIFIDFGLFKGDSTRSLLGTKITSYKDHVLNQPLHDSLFSTPVEVVQNEKIFQQSESFWAEKRHLQLSKQELGLEKMIDTLNKDRKFLRIVGAVRFLFEGYTPIVPAFEVGPVNTFYSFNPIEGLRVRVGGRTSFKFSKHFMLEGYGAYGFRDKQWKGYIGANYALGGSTVRMFPLNQVRVWYQDEIKIPGQELQFVQEDNFFLSFKRGLNNKMIYGKTFGIEYIKENRSGFSYSVFSKKIVQSGAGALLFDYRQNEDTLYKRDIRVTEVGFTLRYAPNEKFYQGARYRTPFLTKDPIFDFSYTAGIKNALNGEYDYHSLKFKMRKGMFLSPIGWGILTVEAGRTFGKVPYPLLVAHRANQTYAYQLESYNLMNFLEFVSDKYASINYFHNFGGVIFGRIPLLKHLKLREVFTVKALWGGVDKDNLPTASNGLLTFPTDDAGNPITFTLEKKPYIEGSIGVANIFKVLRVDLVRRFTYLDNPGVTKMGIRIRFKPEF